MNLIIFRLRNCSSKKVKMVKVVLIVVLVLYLLILEIRSETVCAECVADCLPTAIRRKRSLERLDVYYHVFTTDASLHVERKDPA